MNAFMAVMTGHVHRRGAAVGCESVPCHDCTASWPGEPTGHHLLTRGLPGSLNDLFHVSSDDSLQSHGARSSRFIKIDLFHASSDDSLQSHGARSSRYIKIDLFHASVLHWTWALIPFNVKPGLAVVDQRLQRFPKRPSTRQLPIGL